MYFNNIVTFTSYQTQGQQGVSVWVHAEYDNSIVEICTYTIINFNKFFNWVFNKILFLNKYIYCKIYWIIN